MNKRYWFVVAEINSVRLIGKLSFGYIADDKKPLNNVSIKEGIIETNPDLKKEHITVLGFQEFKNETDYNNFWKK